MQPSASVRPAPSIVTMRPRRASFPGIAGSTGFFTAAFACTVPFGMEPPQQLPNKAGYKSGRRDRARRNLDEDDRALLLLLLRVRERLLRWLRQSPIRPSVIVDHPLRRSLREIALGKRTSVIRTKVVA